MSTCRRWLSRASRHRRGLHRPARGRARQPRRRRRLRREPLRVRRFGRCQVGGRAVVRRASDPPGRGTARRGHPSLRGGSQPIGLAMILTVVANAATNVLCLRLLRSGIAVMVFKSPLPDLLIGFAVVAVVIWGGWEIWSRRARRSRARREHERGTRLDVGDAFAPRKREEVFYAVKGWRNDDMQ